MTDATIAMRSPRRGVCRLKKDDVFGSLRRQVQWKYGAQPSGLGPVCGRLKVRESMELSDVSAKAWTIRLGGFVCAVATLGFCARTIWSVQDRLRDGTMQSLSDSRPFQCIVLFGVVAILYVIGAVTQAAVTKFDSFER